MVVRLVLMPETVADPIIGGEVSIPGLELDVVSEMNGRSIRSFADLDAAADDSDAHSCGSGTLIQYATQGQRELRRFLPVFYARGPKCRNILVRDDGSVAKPTDLAGARVGVSSFTNTASIWIRGWLQDTYGLDPSSITWVEGEQDFIAVDTPAFRRERAGGEGDRLALIGMLKRGQLDAVCWTGGVATTLSTRAGLSIASAAIRAASSLWSTTQETSSRTIARHRLTTSRRLSPSKSHCFSARPRRLGCSSTCSRQRLKSPGLT